MKKKLVIGRGGNYFKSIGIGIGVPVACLLVSPIVVLFIGVLFVGLPILGLLGLLKIEKNNG